MNKRYVHVVGISVILSLMGSHSLRAEEPKKEDHTAKQAETSSAEEASKRGTKVDELAVYNSVLEALKKTVSIKAIGADEKKTEKVFKISGDKLTVKENNQEVVKSSTLAKDIEALKVYREKLKSCEDGSSAKLISTVLDGYMKKLLDVLTADVSASVTVEGLGATTKQIFSSIDKDNNHLLSEKMVNTYTLQLEKFFEEKGKKLDSSEEEKKAVSALDSIAAILWGGKMRRDVFTEEKAKDDAETKQIVTNGKAAVEALAKSDKVCKEVETAKAPVGGDSSREVKKGEEVGPINGTGETQDPSSTPGNQNAQNQNSATPPQDFDALFKQLQDRFAADNQLAQNQLREALDAARRASDDAALRAAQQDQLSKALLDNNQLNNNALGEALRALGQQEAPQNRSANRENSDSRSPQISPSLDTGSGGQPQIPPPPPFQPPPPPPTLPLGMLQPPPTPPMPAYQPPPRNWEADAPRPAPVVVQDPRTSGLMELLKFQQQMQQQQMMMMQQRMYPQQPGGPNIYGNMGRLATYGSSGATGSRRGTMTRMNGTASGGAQGRMGSVPRARTTPPK